MVVGSVSVVVGFLTLTWSLANFINGQAGH